MTIERLSAALADRYGIERELGQGGMATVYLAKDLKHDRMVAIKVLKPELAAVLGAERFIREIKTTASLQHPHILPLHDSGEVGGFLFYVMPFVDGETLRDKLDREKQLGIDEAVRITRDVADALHHAHLHGVVHRDIKPENILLANGRPMVADFGIALAISTSAGNRVTETGMSIGTPQYMSPEQAMADDDIGSRSDLFSLATVLYEMLAGEPPFSGPTSQAIVAAVLASEPELLTGKRRTVPRHVAAAIHIALEKSPADRFATVAEFAESLNHPTARTTEWIRLDRGGSTVVGRWRVPVITTALALIVGLIAGRFVFGGLEAPSHVTRHLSIVLPETEPLALTGPGPLGIWQSAVAMAPAGTMMAYVALLGDSSGLVVRSLAGDSSAVIPGTKGAYHPFFSPDGMWIGFFSGNELRKVATSGGVPITMASVERPTGATWASDDRILLSEQDGFRLRWVSTAGGRDSVITLATQFGTPSILPGGDHALGQLSSGQLAVLSLTDLKLRAITRRGVLALDEVQLEDLLFGASPRFINTGHIVFGTDDGTLMAIPFDPRRMAVLGEARAVVTGVRIEEGFGFAEYAVADDGTLVYVPGLSQLQGRIAVVTPSGQLDTLPFPRGQYTQLRVSPDGKRLAAQLRKSIGGWEVLIMDLETGVRQQVPVPGEFRAFPASWSPDSRELMIGLWDPVQFLAHGATVYSLERGTWESIELSNGSYMSISPNGKDFVFSDWQTGQLYVKALRGDTTRLAIPGRGFAASYSPDGRWLAWGNLEGGVSVSSVPPSGRAFTVTDRGQQPLWSPDGQRLIYRDGRRFLEVDVSMVDGFRAGRSRTIAEGPFIRTFAWNHTIAPDGRLMVLVSASGESARELGVITGFDLEVKRLAPVRNR